MRYGSFDDEHREYVIQRPDTPLPWINYLGGESYFGLVSNTGGGYSFYRDARLRRLTRYRYNSAPLDTDGRHLYLRDDGPLAPGTPRFWSPTWRPCRTRLDSYECRHGLGYTTIESSLSGIQCRIRYLVPPGETLEIWRVTIRNDRTAPASLSLFSAVEFCLWDAWDDATNFQRNLSVGEAEVVDGVVYHTSEYPRAPEPLRLFRLLRAGGGFRYAAGSIPRPGSRLGQPGGRGGRPAFELDRLRLAADRHTPRTAHAGASKREDGPLPPRLRRESPGGEVRPTQVGDLEPARGGGDSVALSRSSGGNSAPSTCCALSGRSGWPACRFTLPIHTPTAWSTSGTPTR